MNSLTVLDTALRTEYNGAFNEMLYKFLLDQGVQRGQLTEMYYAWLIDRYQGDINSAQVQFIEQLVLNNLSLSGLGEDGTFEPVVNVINVLTQPTANGLNSILVGETTSQRISRLTNRGSVSSTANLPVSTTIRFISEGDIVVDFVEDLVIETIRFSYNSTGAPTVDVEVNVNITVEDLPEALAPPSASNTLNNLTATQNADPFVIDASQDFSNAAEGTWSVSGQGASIDQSGVVTITTAVARISSEVVVTYTNASGSATSSFEVTINEDTVTGVLQESDVEELRTNPTTRGVYTDSVLTDAEDYTFPTGMSLSDGLLSITSSLPDNTVIEDVHFENVQVRHRGDKVIEFRNCLFEQNTVDGLSTGIIDVWANSGIVLFRCSMVGSDGLETLGTTGVSQRDDATLIDIQECEFFRMGSDTIKSTAGGIIKGNYFDCPTNLPPGTAAYDNTFSYSIGDVVTDSTGSRAYISLTDSNVGNDIPTNKTDNDDWESFDPHADTINPYIVQAPLLIEGNYFNRLDDLRFGDTSVFRAIGINNAVRLDFNNNNTDEPHDQVTIRYNIFTASSRNASFPISLEDDTANSPNSVVDIVENNWVTRTNGGLYITGAGNNIIGTNPVYTPPNTPTAGGYGLSDAVDGATVLTIDEALTPLYDSDKFGAGTASVPITGTHDSDGSSLQYRIVNDDTNAEVRTWSTFTAGTGGVWEVRASIVPSNNNLRAEVRSFDDASVNAAQTGTWQAGYWVGLSGQSLAARPFSHTLTGDNLTVPTNIKTYFLLNDRNGTLADGIISATDTMPIGIKRYAAFFGAYSSVPIGILDLTDSGTSRKGEADDDDTDRDWFTATELPALALRNTGAGDPSFVMEAWYTNDASTAGSLGDSVDTYSFIRTWLPTYTGIMLDGVANTPDNTGLTPYDGSEIDVRTTYTPEHWKWRRDDNDSVGLFDPDRTKFIPFNGATHRASNDIVDGDASAGDEAKGRIRQALREMVDEQAFADIRKPTGSRFYGGHLAQPNATHVEEDDPDGEGLVATHYAAAIMRALGYLPDVEPQIDKAGIAWATDGSYVDVPFLGLTSNGLSTPLMRFEAGDFDNTFESEFWIDATTNPAELHDIQGFTLTKGGNLTYLDFHYRDSGRLCEDYSCHSIR